MVAPFSNSWSKTVLQTHKLKTLARYFDAVKRGDKTFEVRKNDRAYQTGDVLELYRIEENRQYVVMDDHGMPAGCERLKKRVSYLLQGGQFGVEPAYCVLGLADCEVPHAD